mgnify:CR=1 FL=1
MLESNNGNRNAGHKSGRRIARTLIVLLGLGGLAGIGGVAGVIGAYYYVSPSLPQAETIRDIPLQIPLRIFSRDGRLIEEIGEQRRVLVQFDDVPLHVMNAFIAAEDRRFFEHPGIDYRGVLRAAIQWLTTGSGACRSYQVSFSSPSSRALVSKYFFRHPFRSVAVPHIVSSVSRCIRFSRSGASR